MNNLIKNIKILREYNNISINDISLYLKILPKIYKMYEKSNLNIPLSIVEKLSDLYGFTLIDLYDEVLTKSKISLIGLKINDMHEISYFNNLVKEYLKLKYIEKYYK